MNAHDVAVADAAAAQIRSRDQNDLVYQVAALPAVANSNARSGGFIDDTHFTEIDLHGNSSAGNVQQTPMSSYISTLTAR